MALAFLCQEVVKADSPIMAPLFSTPDYPRTKASFDAFIVDHRMRQGSDVEARKVAKALRKLGVRAHVLQTDWSAHGDPSQLSNVETTARGLRYQTIGRACKKNNINALLLAHHADDQHESVLTRIYSNYLGAGLQGMNDIANIPACNGIYGVDQSGWPIYSDSASDSCLEPQDRQPMAIESGGVTISRPLLSLTKERLVTLCEDNGIEWFEDATNKDPTLTVRNTFRHVIRNEQLPLALSRPRILQLATTILNDTDEVEAAAKHHFNEMPSTVNFRSGTATFTLALEVSPLYFTRSKILASLLRQMLDTVSPKSTISLQNLDGAVDFVFGPEHSNKKSPRITVAGVDIQEDTLIGKSVSTARKFSFRRQNPEGDDNTMDFVLPVPSNFAIGKWSEWKLWDGRYWIRVRPPIISKSNNISVVVKFLSKDDIAALRHSVTDAARNVLNDRLGAVSMGTRYTLPAIVTRESSALNGDVHDTIVALPTLEWCIKGWRSSSATRSTRHWLWDIRYKRINFDAGKNHRIIPSGIDASGRNIKRKTAREQISGSPLITADNNRTTCADIEQTS